MFKNRFRNLSCVGLIILAFLASGCGKSLPPTDKAERDVEIFLDAWSRGESVDQFADTTRPIQGTDPDWKAGHRLLSSLVSDTKQSPEAPDHVRCTVDLALQNKQGKRWDTKVVYDVQLGEKSIISRASP